MRQTLGMQTWSGALTIGSFIVISLTGILMFFHINIGLVKLAHEWLSWVFVVAAICHAIVHWKLLLGYFRNRAALALMVPILVLGGLSLIPAGGNGPTHPLVQVMARLERAPLESVAKLGESDPSAVIQTLKASGIEVETPGQTIAEIAEKNGKRPMDVLLILFSDRSSTQHKSRRG